jgi:short subunit dehydrogenase-like uncharacterized protein
MTKLMIYGAAGYTGRMAAAHARDAGLPLVLAGRSAAVVDLAGKLQAESRVFGLEDEGAIDAALSDVSVLLNCAGPFMHTAEPLMRAAIRRGVHYLDIAAELNSYQLAETLDGQAQKAGVMLLPGSGGSVAMLGSLAGHAAGRVQRPQKIAIAIHVSGSMSRGSAISATQNVSTRTLIRKDGQLVDRPASDLAAFDFGEGPVASFPVTLPDLITIARATGAPNVETYVHVSGDAFPQDDLSRLPDGPSAEARAANRYQAAVQVTGDDGVVVRSILDTVNGYSFTSLAAAEAARRVLAGESRPGFQTPAGLFGDGFAETIADTRIVDM